MAGCRGEALAGTWRTLLPGIRQPTGLLVWTPSQVHTLLIHPLSLHPLDKAEEILIRHGGASGQHIRGWTALVINPGGLVFDKHVEKLIPWLLGVPVASEVPHVVEGDAKPRQAAYASPLVIQPAALGAGNEVKELFSLW